MKSLIQLIIFIYALVVTKALVSFSGASYNCSGQLSSEVACSNAFDNNITTFWMNDINITSPQQQYVVITLSSPMVVTSYMIYMLAMNSVIGNYDYSFQVTSWAFQGSNNNSSYTTLSTVTDYNINNIVDPGAYIVFNCTLSASYKYYRFNVLANWFINNGYSTQDSFMLIELVLNGTYSPSSQPTSQPSSPSSQPTSQPSSQPSSPSSQPSSSPTPSPTTPFQTIPSAPSRKSNTAVIVAVTVIGALVVVAIVVAVLFRSYKTKQHQHGTGTTDRKAAISHRISVSHTATEQQNPMQSTTQHGI